MALASSRAIQAAGAPGANLAACRLANGRVSHFKLAGRGTNATVFVAIRLRVATVGEDQLTVEALQELRVASIVSHRRDGHLANAGNRQALRRVVVESNADLWISERIAVPSTIGVDINQQLAGRWLRVGDVGERQQPRPGSTTPDAFAVFRGILCGPFKSLL